MSGIKTVSTIRLGSTTLRLNTQDLTRDIIKIEALRRRKASKHLVKSVKKNISQHGESLPGEFPGRLTDHLYKNIKYKDAKGQKTFVGSKSPHAHLLEFGHGDGKQFNKRPFLRKTFEQENSKVIELLSEEYF